MLIMQTYELHALIQVMMNSKEKKTFISGRHTNKSIKRGLNNGSDMPFLIEFEITIFFFTKINTIKTYDISTLYTTSPHGKLKSRMLYDIIDNCF